MKRKKTTILDVAKYAGLSKSTVSRVLNNSGYVSSEAKEKVCKAIKELEFKPNAAARGLVLSRTNTIGVIVSNVWDSFFSRVLKGVEVVASERNYNLLTCSTDWKKELEYAYLNLLRERRVDGLLMISGTMVRDDYYFHIKEIFKYDIPFVVLDRHITGVKISSVNIDNLNGAYKMVEHLYNLGHKRIGFISGPSDLEASKERLEGYKKATNDFSLDIDDNLIVHGDFKKDGGIKAVDLFLNLDKKPTAIFASNDLMAIGVWKALEKKGLRIPDDMAVVGFDDIEPLSLFELPLTTMRQPQFELGKLGMEILCETLDGDCQEPKNIFLSPELVVRGSCGAM